MAEQHIRALRAAELRTLIESERFRQMPHIPISYHRAISQLNNPRAAPEDVLLLMAQEANTMIGYLGLLPDWIFPRQDEDPVKIAWMSCLWIHPEARGKGIAGQLVREAFRQYEGRIIASEYTAAAKKLYQKLGFFAPLPDLPGVRLYFRWDLSFLLPPKHPFFVRITPILQFTDRLLNGLMDWRLQTPRSSVEWQWVRHLGPRDKLLIDQYQKATFCRRGYRELQWMLDYPWLLTGSGADPRYAFSSSAPRVVSQAIRGYGQSGRPFLLFILLRENHLKIPYLLAEPRDYAEVTALLLELVKKMGVRTCSLYDEAFTAFLATQRLPVLYRKPVGRSFLVGRPLLASLHNSSSHFQAGDGDAAFT